MVVVKGKDASNQSDQPPCQARVHASGAFRLCRSWQNEIAHYSAKPVDQTLQEGHFGDQIFLPVAEQMMTVQLDRYNN